MEIHVVRHTAVEGMEGVCYGQSDVGLAKDYMASFTQIEIEPLYDRVISSPLTRCTQLADYLQLPYETDSRLMEINFGNWELKKWDDITREEFDLWHQDYINTPPPNGESLASMQQRVLELLTELKNQHPMGKVLLITHAGVIRIIVSHIMGIPLSDMFTIKVGFGEIMKMQY